MSDLSHREQLELRLRAELDEAEHRLREAIRAEIPEAPAVSGRPSTDARVSWWTASCQASAAITSGLFSPRRRTIATCQ